MPSASRKETLIHHLRLKPHPEGGYYSEVYRSKGVIKTTDGSFPDQRNYSTSIYYLLGGKDISKLHRIRSDEIWHHYEGNSLTIHLIYPEGNYEKLLLGKDLTAGQQPQHVVPAGCWFGVTPVDSHGFTLAGCTVAPGFDFRDFEIADRNEMLRKFPGQEPVINILLPGS